jgi:hypothetical protein
MLQKKKKKKKPDACRYVQKKGYPQTQNSILFYIELLGLEKETKMTPLPLCKKKKKHLLCFLCSIYVHKTSFFFFFFSCRSLVTASLAFLNFFLLLSIFFFFFGPTLNSKLLGFLQFSSLFGLLQNIFFLFISPSSSSFHCNST